MSTRIIVITVLLASACTPNAIQNSPQPHNTPLATEKYSLEVTITPAMATQDELQKKLTQMARHDLASHLSVDIEKISTVSIESIVWPDTALGCPRPGKSYTQQTTLGYLVHLEAAGQEYIYHTDIDQTVILYMDENLPSFPVTPGEIYDGKPWMPVEPNQVLTRRSRIKLKGW
jgi:hypothetical protein